MTPSARPRLVVHVSIPKVPAATPDEASEAAPECGWYESSWALRQGLAVSELADSDGTVAALWFAAPAGPASACLQ